MRNGNCVKMKKMVGREREPQQFQPAPEKTSFHPPERKTELMMEVENRFGGQPIEEILFHFYGEQENSLAKTAEIIEVTPTTIKPWMRKCGIKFRSKSEAQKILWQDPERKEELLKKLITPQARLKKRQATRAQWRNQREKMMEANQSGAQTRIRRNERRLVERMGRPKKEYLEEAKKLGLTKTEVCSSLKIHHSTLNRLLEEEEIKLPSGPESFIQREWEERKESPEMKLVEKARKMGIFFDLSEGEQVILNGRFPKEDDVPQSLSSLGRKLGFSKQWAHKIQNEAIEKMRLKLESI